MDKAVITTEVSDNEEEEYEEEEIEESYVYYSDQFTDDLSDISFSLSLFSSFLIKSALSDEFSTRYLAKW